jgi:hypothetical protein
MRQFLHEHVRGKTLMLVGDSITNLFYHGFLCETARYGLTVLTDHPRLQSFIGAYRAVPVGEWVENGAPHQHVYVKETDSVISHKGCVTDTSALLSLCDIVVINYGAAAARLRTSSA